VASDFTNLRIGAVMEKLQGSDKRDKWRIGYSQSGKRCGERAETKASAIREHYKNI
jgi:hypothetical protein